LKKPATLTGIAVAVSCLAFWGIQTGTLNPYRIARKYDFWKNHPGDPLEIDKIEANLSDIKSIEAPGLDKVFSRNEVQNFVSILKRLGPYRQTGPIGCSFGPIPKPPLSGVETNLQDDLVIFTSSGNDYLFTPRGCTKKIYMDIQKLLGTVGQD
jgi:hypothetical protein